MPVSLQNVPFFRPRADSRQMLATTFSPKMPWSHELFARDDDAVLTNDDFYRHFGDLEDAKDQDATPKGLHDQWRFTPSLMDPNSFAFSTFANQPPAYYTPTSGGVNTLYHSQAGDLHTPGMGMNIVTPLSLPQTAHALPASNVNLSLHHYQPQLLQPHQFENAATYTSQQLFAPSSFLQHKDSGYEAMSQSPQQSPRKAEAGMTVPGASISGARNADGRMAAAPPGPRAAKWVASPFGLLD